MQCFELREIWVAWQIVEEVNPRSQEAKPTPNARLRGNWVAGDRKTRSGTVFEPVTIVRAKYAFSKSFTGSTKVYGCGSVCRSTGKGR
jgi:hypothetical protein